MSNYKEIISLKEMLEKENITFSFKELFDGAQIVVMSNNHSISIIEHKYSYGSEKDLLEIMGCLTKEEKKDDAVLGYLTAEEVFKRVKYCLEYDTDEYIGNNCTENEKGKENRQQELGWKKIVYSYCEQMSLIKNIINLFAKISPKKYSLAKVKIETWCDQSYLKVEFYEKETYTSSSKEDVLKTPLIYKTYIDILGKEFAIKIGDENDA